VLDRLRPSRKNRLDCFPDDFFQFLDGFKPSKIPNFFFVVDVLGLIGKRSTPPQIFYKKKIKKKKKKKKKEVDFK